jgi:hypothetical protein
VGAFGCRGYKQTSADGFIIRRLTIDVPEPSPPAAEEPGQKQVHRLKAADLITGSPRFGEPSLGELRVDPSTGEVTYVNSAQRRNRTARARQEKNETKAVRRRKILERHALALSKKNRTRKGNAGGTMKEIAEVVLNDLKAEDPGENRTVEQIIEWGRKVLRESNIWEVR